MELPKSSRCILCLKRSSSNKWFEYREKKLIFCGEKHFNKYKELKQTNTKWLRDDYRKCHNPYCSILINVQYIEISCDCGLKHDYCSNRCKSTRETLVERHQNHEIDSIDLVRKCQTCFCSDIDMNSICSYGHGNRCMMCGILGRCRICEAQTWYQKILVYIGLVNTVWEVYKKQVVINKSIKCIECDKESDIIYLSERYDCIVCNKCASKYMFLCLHNEVIELYPKYIGTA